MPKQKRYMYKDQTYQFIFTGKMKIGQVWIMCCIYKSYKDGRIYVRERGDFNEKFKPVVDKIEYKQVGDSTTILPETFKPII
jgi:hypothetical protein